jgi:hypothetical protein
MSRSFFSRQIGNVCKICIILKLLFKTRLALATIVDMPADIGNNSNTCNVQCKDNS